MAVADQRLVLRLQCSALDDEGFDLGIVRITPDERVSFLNRAARAMMNNEIDVGDPVDIVPMDDESRVRLRAELDDRFEFGRGSAYQLRLRRKDSQAAVRVRVTAVPDLDEQGRMAGSVGIVIDDSVETAILGIHQAIQQAADSPALYAALEAHLRQVLDFDTLLITGINRRRTHLQRLCELPPGPLESLPTKWWPMRPFVRKMIEEFEAGPQDLDKLFARPDFLAYAAADRSVADFRARGFQHSLRLGVHQGAQLVATVSLLRRAPLAFTREDLKRLERLPIVEVVNAALARERQGEMQFALRMVSEIAAGGGDSDRIAHHIVQRLAEHFRWEHVSLMRVDTHREHIRLVAQAGPSSLPDDFEQSSKRGLLGQACEELGAVKVGDATDPDQRGRYLKGIEDTRSELVIPLFGRSQAVSLDEPERLAWLLNIESRMRDAFADEEQESVDVLIRVAAVMLDRAATLEVTTELVRAVGDGVVQTDELGVILHANPAAERLLDRRMDAAPGADAGDGLRHRNLATLLALEGDDGNGADGPDSGAGGDSWSMASTSSAFPSPSALLSDPADVHGQPMRVLRPDGASRRVLLSSSVLKGVQGGRIVVLTDVSQHDRIERLTLLQRGLGRISGEIRAPIALAATFLAEMRARSEPTVEAIDKALQQLRKAMLPLEGMLRLESALDDAPLPGEPVDLLALVTRIREQLPASERRAVRVVSRDAPSLTVCAAPHELAFCIESTLSHLLRAKAQDEVVEVMVGQVRQVAFVRLTATSDLADGPQPWHDAAADGASLPDEFLERAVVDGLLQRMGGSFSIRGQEARGNPSYRLSMAYLGDKNEVQAADRA